MREKNAVFIGEDNSCGFRTYRHYDLLLYIKGGWIWVDDESGRKCPYESIRALLKNWRFAGMNEIFRDYEYSCRSTSAFVDSMKVYMEELNGH